MGLKLVAPHDRGIGECRSIRVNGLPGVGGYFLVVSLEFSIGRVAAPTRFRRMRLLLESDRGVRGRIGWGEHDAQGDVQVSEYSDHLNMTFLTKLSASDVTALEAIRGGGDISLGVWLFGECEQSGETTAIRDHSTYAVPQDQWLKALAEMEYTRTLTFELRFPMKNVNESDTVISLLKEARIQLARGNYSDCVLNCRKIIEIVSNGDAARLRDALRKFREEPRSMTLEERMQVVKESARHAAHLAAHSVPDQGEYGYSEARALFAITVALVSDSEMDFMSVDPQRDETGVLEKH